MNDDLTYPAEALRVAHGRGVESSYKLTDVKRAFMEGVIALCEFRKEPAPQWMVDTLWQDSATRQWAERRLQA